MGDKKKRIIVINKNENFICIKNVILIYIAYLKNKFIVSVIKKIYVLCMVNNYFIDIFSKINISEIYTEYFNFFNEISPVFTTNDKKEMLHKYKDL